MSLVPNILLILGVQQTDLIHVYIAECFSQQFSSHPLLHSYNVFPVMRALKNVLVQIL